jgi:ketosteroid isomerase-like protein
MRIEFSREKWRRHLYYCRITQHSGSHNVYARFHAAMLAVLLVTSPAGSQETANEETIRAARAASNDAIARHDAQAIVSFLDSEYQITTSVGQMFQGTEGEVSTWNRLFAERQDVVYVRTPDNVEISLDYPLASESGRWVGTWTSTEGPVRTGGDYQAMWRKTPHGWKIRAELFVALYCKGDGCPRGIQQ